jgi:hypothetical protein
VTPAAAGDLPATMPAHLAGNRDGARLNIIIFKYFAGMLAYAYEMCL